MTKRIIAKTFFYEEGLTGDDIFYQGIELKENEKLISTHVMSNVANRRKGGGYHDTDVVLIIEVTDNE